MLQASLRILRNHKDDPIYDQQDACAAMIIDNHKASHVTLYKFTNMTFVVGLLFVRARRRAVVDETLSSLSSRNSSSCLMCCPVDCLIVKVEIDFVELVDDLSRILEAVRSPKPAE